MTTNNTSLVPKNHYVPIPCLLCFHSIHNIKMISTRPMVNSPKHVVAVVYHPTLQFHALSNQLALYDTKKISRSQYSSYSGMSYKIFYEPTFSSTDQLSFSVWQSTKSQMILPQQMPLEISLMTGKEKIFIGKTCIQITNESLNKWYDAIIEPITHKNGVFRRGSIHHKFREYPHCKYSLDSAKLKLKMEMKCIYASLTKSLKSESFSRKIPSHMDNLDSESLVTIDQDMSTIVTNTDKYLSSEKSPKNNDVKNETYVKDRATTYGSIVLPLHDDSTTITTSTSSTAESATSLEVCAHVTNRNVVSCYHTTRTACAHPKERTGEEKKDISQCYAWYIN